MLIQLSFKNIIDNPKCRIWFNTHKFYDGIVPEYYEIQSDILSKECSLRIDLYDKSPADTLVENGKIIRDKSFELEKVIIDSYDIQELIWNSEYVAESGEIYPGCLFFGPNGTYTLNFYQPVVHWILHTRNEPGWEEDYEYYDQACKLLKQI